MSGGEAFISDLGMTGPEHSVLGVRPELTVAMMKDKLPVRFFDGRGRLFPLRSSAGGRQIKRKNRERTADYCQIGDIMIIKKFVASECGAVLDSDVKNGGGTDDTAVLQGILDMAQKDGVGFTSLWTAPLS